MKLYKRFSLILLSFIKLLVAFILVQGFYILVYSIIFGISTINIDYLWFIYGISEGFAPVVSNLISAIYLLDLITIALFFSIGKYTSSIIDNINNSNKSFLKVWVLLFLSHQLVFLLLRDQVILFKLSMGVLNNQFMFIHLILRNMLLLLFVFLMFRNKQKWQKLFIMAWMIRDNGLLVKPICYKEVLTVSWLMFFMLYSLIAISFNTIEWFIYILTLNFIFLPIIPSINSSYQKFIGD